MRKCAEMKEVSREDGKIQKRCARYEDVTEDIMVKDSGNHNMGLVVPEPLTGLAEMRMDDFAWPMFGAAAAGLGALVSRRWGYQLHSKIPEFAGLVGAAIGVLASIPLYWAKGQSAMTQAAVSSVMVGLTIYGLPKVEEMLMTGPAAAPTGLLTAAEVGRIPQIADSGAMPPSVRHQADTGAYGAVI